MDWVFSNLVSAVFCSIFCFLWIHSAKAQEKPIVNFQPPFLTGLSSGYYPIYIVIYFQRSRPKNTGDIQ